MLLKDKVAVIYGAGGAIGGAVARAFASEGATLHLTGRSLAPVEAVAEDVVAAGGLAEAAEVDALDEHAVDAHLDHVIEEAGRVDISFNAVGFPDADIVGVPLVELDVKRFSLPIATYTTSYFVTARLAARRMIPLRSGVIMRVTALLARTGAPLIGGYGPAMAALEALTRDLSAELAPHGIRVVGLRPQAMPETDTIREAFEPRAEATGMKWEQWQELLASRTHPRRLMTLARAGRRGGLHGLRPGERDDGNHRQPDHGKPGRLAALSAISRGSPRGDVHLVALGIRGVHHSELLSRTMRPLNRAGRATDIEGRRTGHLVVGGHRDRANEASRRSCRRPAARRDVPR